MSSSKEFLQVKRKVRIPPTGWSAETFQGQQAVSLIQAIIRVEHAAVAKGIRAYSQVLSVYFKGIFDSVTRIVEDRARAANYKAEGFLEIEIDPTSHSALWEQAINDVFAEKDAEFDAELLSNVQSVGVEVHRKTTLLLGATLTAPSVDRVRRRMISMSQDVGAKINKTTRKRLYKMVQNAVLSGSTVADTIEVVRSAADGVAAGRISTIARTMMGLAADEGNKTAYIESDEVTHVSVFGCHSIEEGSPTYMGIHTCNIQDVPVEDIDMLEFHPNHTGTIIPSRFRQANGLAGHFPTHGGVGADG